MKKLTKLQINPEKLMKNEELLMIRGGYDQCEYWCCVYDGAYPNGTLLTCGVGCGESQFGAEQDCDLFYQQYGFDCKCW